MVATFNSLDIVEQPKRSHRRRVALVRPAKIASAGTWSLPVTPPLGPAYIAAVLREEGHEVMAVDAMAERLDQRIRDGHLMFQGLTIEETVNRIDPRAEVIGVTIMFTQDWPYAKRLIRAIRERFPEALIVAGGEHMTALPEFNLRDCPELDVCVLGEGEETMAELVQYADRRDEFDRVKGVAFLKDGQYVQTCARQRIRDVEKLPQPAWDLFPIETYLSNRNAFGVYRGRSMAILATRGCPYKCTFCSNPSMYGVAWIARQPESVLNEIEGYIRDYGAENIDFYDLTMVLKREWILEFCGKIEERGLKFTWQLPSGTRSEVIDDEVAAALYRTGCRNVTYAPESGSVRTLQRIKKRLRLPRLLESVRAALRNKIHVKCNIVLGFPDDERSDVLQTVAFCWKLAVMGIDAVEVMLFTPYPGSQLFDELRADGTIGELDDEFFRSMVAFLDPFVPSKYCKHVGGLELSFWRFFTMGSFFAISFALRPWRLVRLVVNIVKDRSETVLEHRLGQMLRRPSAKPAPVHAAPTVG